MLVPYCDNCQAKIFEVTSGSVLTLKWVVKMDYMREYHFCSQLCLVAWVAGYK